MKYLLLLFLFLVIFACRKPDKTLQRKDGKWTMYITEVEKVNGSNMSTTLYDTLDVEFSSSTNGVFKKSNGTDTLKSFTWSYERRDELLNPNLKCISFFTVGYIRETSYKVVENKRNKECWQSTDWDFMSGRNIKTEIILIRK